MRRLCIFQCGSQFQPFYFSLLATSWRACSAGVASQQKALIVSNTAIILGAILRITLSIKLTPCHTSGSFYFSSFKRETRSFKDSWWGNMSVRVLVRTMNLQSWLKLNCAGTSERTIHFFFLIHGFMNYWLPLLTFQIIGLFFSTISLFWKYYQLGMKLSSWDRIYS